MNCASGAPRVGVIGLGIMGGAMAEALLARGHPVVGYDVAPAARRRLKRAGGLPLYSSGAVAERANFVITSLASAAALEDAAARIARARRRPGLIVIETSTLALADKERARRQLARAGVETLDCPVSGTAVRMKEGAWTIFASGARGAFERAAPILHVFTQRVPYCGRFGNGTRMKLVANHLVAILNVATAESLVLGRKLGLDPQLLLAQFGASPVVGTGVYRLRGAMMARRRYRPPTMKVEVWQKDMQVIGDTAKVLDCPVPLFSACAPIYSAAMAQGLAQSDTASVHEVLAKMAGVSRRTAR